MSQPSETLDESSRKITMSQPNEALVSTTPFQSLFVGWQKVPKFPNGFFFFSFSFFLLSWEMGFDKFYRTTDEPCYIFSIRCLNSENGA